MSLGTGTQWRGGSRLCSIILRTLVSGLPGALRSHWWCQREFKGWRLCPLTCARCSYVLYPQPPSTHCSEVIYVGISDILPIKHVPHTPFSKLSPNAPKCTQLHQTVVSLLICDAPMCLLPLSVFQPQLLCFKDATIYFQASFAFVHLNTSLYSVPLPPALIFLVVNPAFNG